MKLIIQIPCFNEEQTLGLVLKSIPKQIPGIDVIETQIIDDGSTDNTSKIAKEFGVNHIISYIGNKGLGHAFKIGCENAIEHHADILVNTDGDNQYNSSDIPKLIRPILEKSADIVVGDRQTKNIHHFSFFKKLLQKLGSKVTSQLTNTKINDAVSGFRAYSRQALLEINITTEFSYVIDTILQASKKRLKTEFIPITTNPPTRPSRLFKNIWQHIKNSTANMIRVYTMYEPYKVFLSLGSIFLIIGFYPFARFLYFYLHADKGMHVQSLILGATCLIIGTQFLGLGIIGDLMAKQRKLTEDVLYRLKSKK